MLSRSSRCCCCCCWTGERSELRAPLADGALIGSSQTWPTRQVTQKRDVHRKNAPPTAAAAATTITIYPILYTCREGSLRYTAGTVTQTVRSLSLSSSLSSSLSRLRLPLATRSLAFQFATWLSSFVARGFCNLAAQLCSALLCCRQRCSLRCTAVVSLAHEQRAQ